MFFSLSDFYELQASFFFFLFLLPFLTVGLYIFFFLLRIPDTGLLINGHCTLCFRRPFSFLIKEQLRTFFLCLLLTHDVASYLAVYTRNRVSGSRARLLFPFLFFFVCVCLYVCLKSLFFFSCALFCSFFSPRIFSRPAYRKNT